MNKVVLFGATGKLGKELANLRSFTTPSHEEVDITNLQNVKNYLEKENPEIVIHSAALVGAKECKEDEEKANRINIGGTRNIAEVCKENKIKLIYISTDTIFDGKKGNYTEEDTPNPINHYSKTKLEGEKIVKTLDNYLIIRTSFFHPTDFPYPKVFTNQYTGRMPVNDLAKEIILAMDNNVEGIINIAGKRDTLYNIVKKFKPEIGETTLEEAEEKYNLKLPRDLSLDTTKWEKIKNGFKTI